MTNANTERAKRMVAARKLAGLVEVRLWIHPEQKPRLRAYVAKLNKPAKG